MNHMEEKKENAQSRREFFKNAAKNVLPILGITLLANIPMTIHATETPMGCNGCAGKCMASCKGTCNGGCKGSCKYDCTGGCKTGCRNTCKNTCSGRCTGTSK